MSSNYQIVMYRFWDERPGYMIHEILFIVMQDLYLNKETLIGKLDLLKNSPTTDQTSVGTIRELGSWNEWMKWANDENYKLWGVEKLI